jgi:hypothetical protein
VKGQGVEKGSSAKKRSVPENFTGRESAGAVGALRVWSDMVRMFLGNTAMERNDLDIEWVRLVLLLGAVLVVSPVVGAVQFAGGTGEPNDPYLIATADQFLGADFSQPDVYYRLCADIDFRGIPSVYLWPPHFYAYLDGAGHRLQHVTITSSKGLLGTIEPGAIVTDLIIEDAALSWQGLEPTSTVGVLAGENYGTIRRCRVTGWLVVPQAMAVGGLVGDNGGLITNSFFDGCVAANWTPTDFSLPGFPPQVGGLAGVNAGSIINCYAAGTTLGQRCVGGLVGANVQSGEKVGSITDCYATTEVMTELGGGGLVASNVGIITRCYATGWVTGEMSGGLIGLAGLGDGIVIGCVWDVARTHCTTSSGGLGFDWLGMTDPWMYAANGWAGDPNWVVDYGWTNGQFDYPRLFWEGTKGKPAPEPKAPDWPAGSGTPEDPYQIASHTDLDELAAASIFWDKHFILVKDIVYGPARTIGTSRGSAFAGTFDGNGHIIRNMQIDNKDATAWHLGVFGYVTGQIRNLTVENVYLASGPNSRWVGLLAGTCEGLIENCHATGSITVGQDSQYIGGLVGYVAYKGGQVVDCSADATIETGEGSADIGSLIGYEEPDPRRR